MALTLTATLAAPTASAPALWLTVTGTVPAAIDIGYRFRLDNEALELRSFGRTEEAILGGAATENVRDLNSWEVARGLNGTTPASHNSGTAVLGLADALVVGADEDVPAPFAGTGDAVTPAAFVEPTTATPEAIVDALIAAGLMDAS